MEPSVVRSAASSPFPPPPSTLEGQPGGVQLDCTSVMDKDNETPQPYYMGSDSSQSASSTVAPASSTSAFFLSSLGQAPSDVYASNAVFLSELSAHIYQTLRNPHPFDDPKFNMISYINSLFPNEQSLSKIDIYIDKLRRYCAATDTAILKAVRKQATDGESECIFLTFHLLIDIRSVLCTEHTQYCNRAQYIFL